MIVQPVSQRWWFNRGMTWLSLSELRVPGERGDSWETRGNMKRARETIAYTLKSHRFFSYMFKWLSNNGFSTLFAQCVFVDHLESTWWKGCSTYREWYIYRTSGKCANVTLSLHAYFNDPSSAFVVGVELWPLCWQAHLVAAFEKSLGNMTCRLTSLTMTAEQKVRASFCCCVPPLPDTSCMKSRH